MSENLKDLIDKAEEEDVELFKIKNNIINATLDKLKPKIVAKLPSNEEAQEKAMEIIRIKVEKLVDEAVSKKEERIKKHLEK